MPSTRLVTQLIATSSLAFLTHCGGDSGASTGKALCGDVACGLHQVCNDAPAPSCVCEPMYAGAKCDACTPGYSLVGTECEPVTIDCAKRNACGANGTCIEAGTRDRCECTADHTGPTCAQCVDGLQDNDHDGTCAPACGHGPLTCESWEACDDSSGMVGCGCAPHSTGRRCDECASGYYRQADGPCVKACSGSEKCMESMACREVEGKDAACSCPLGSTGDDCKTCAPGFSLRAGICTRAPTPGHLLLGGVEMNWPVLYDFDPQTKASVALRSEFPFLLGADASQHELWGGESVYGGGTTFGRYDLASNTVTPLVGGEMLNSTAVIAGKHGAVFWVEPDGRSESSGMLTRVDIATGMPTSVAPVDIRSIDYLAYDTKNDRLIGAQWEDGLVLVAIDPRTGALATLGKPSIETRGTNPRLTVDAAGQIYMLASIERPANEVLRDMLTRVFARLGLPPIPAAAPIELARTYYVDPSKPEVLTASGINGAEIVAYDCYGGLASGGAAPPMPVEVTVKNPDAVVSLTAFSATLRIQIPADARFKTLFVYGGGAHTLEIAPGFSGANGSIVMVGDKLQHEALAGLSPAVRTYTLKAAHSRRAPVSAYFDDSDDSPPLWLVRVDPTTLAATLVQRMPDEAAQAQALTAY